jgi:hypothetical protein
VSVSIAFQVAIPSVSRGQAPMASMSQIVREHHCFRPTNRKFCLQFERDTGATSPTFSKSLL